MLEDDCCDSASTRQQIGLSLFFRWKRLSDKEKSIQT